MADSIITLDDAGRIVSQKSAPGWAGAEELVGDMIKPEALPTKPETTPTTSSSPGKPVLGDTTNTNGRQSGDGAMYMFYFGTAGWRATAIFLSLQVLFGFFQTFPSPDPPILPESRTLQYGNIH